MYYQYNTKVVSISLYKGFEEEQQDIVKVTTPDYISKQDILNEIKKCHNELQNKNNKETYKKLLLNYSSAIDALMDYVCEKNHWTWDNIKSDIEIDLD